MVIAFTWHITRPQILVWWLFVIHVSPLLSISNRFNY